MEKRAHINDYFYFVVQPWKRGDKEVLLYCSGVNIDRFLPMLRGRFGIGSNPITSGLQLVKYDLCSLAISEGATPREYHGSTDCSGITPSEGTWFTEPLLIENAAALTPARIISFCVSGLLKRIITVSLSDYQLPEDLCAPPELQAHLDTICRQAQQARGIRERPAA